MANKQICICFYWYYNKQWRICLNRSVQEILRPPEMGCRNKIHFIAVLCILSCFYYYVAYNSFCQVVGNQLCPDLLLDEFRLIRMETAQANGVFKLTEREIFLEWERIMTMSRHTPKAPCLGTGECPATPQTFTSLERNRKN